MVPVTIVTGFLGAGKTTAINALLTSSSLRIGLVVNDVGSVNIDAKILAESADGVVELSNGCACCSINTELFGCLEMLLQDREFDNIVIECSGVAEPKRIVESFGLAASRGDPLSKRIKLKRVITIVDCSTLCAILDSRDIMEDRSDLGTVTEADRWQEGRGITRGIVDLVTEQIEAADVVLLSKPDLASDKLQAATMHIVSQLNPGARVTTAMRGDCPCSWFLPAADNATDSTDDEDRDNYHCGVCAAAHSDAFSIETATFTADRPFHPQKFTATVLSGLQHRNMLATLMNAPSAEWPQTSAFSGVIRAKGLVWLASHHDQSWMLSQAGEHVEVKPFAPWGAAGAGTQKQELVFIGCGVKDADTLDAVLRSCLLTDSEMDLYREQWAL